MTEITNGATWAVHALLFALGMLAVLIAAGVPVAVVLGVLRSPHIHAWRAVRRHR